MRPSATRWHARDVVAAMARAIRCTPKGSEDAPSDPPIAPHDSAPLYLTPTLLLFAQQRKQMNARSPALPSTTFANFVDAAQSATTASYTRCQQLRTRPAPSIKTVVRQEESHRAGTEFPPPREAADAELHAELVAALRAYNPTLNDPLQQRIATRVAAADTLRLARQLVRYLRDAAAAEEPRQGAPSLTMAAAMEILQRGIDVCRMRCGTTAANTSGAALSPPGSGASPWAFTTAARESAGIGIRLHHAVASLSPLGHRRRHRLPRCFLLSPADVQLNEVLPSGAVVTFTRPTTPAEVAERDTGGAVHCFREGEDAASATRSKQQIRRERRAPVSFCRSLEVCLASSPPEVYLHCVLYRRSVSVARAVTNMLAVADGLIKREDIRVRTSTCEGDAHVVVQLCSVRVGIPPMLRGEERAEEALQHCLHVARAVAQVNAVASEPAHNARVGLQILHGHLHACTENGAPSLAGVKAVPSQLQYSVLLRGFEHRGGPADQLERVTLACGDLIPNFFSPHHFGPPEVPFCRTYHVTAALEAGRYAEAAAMLLCLECGASSRGAPLVPWLEHALLLLCCGEEREGAWRAWWLQHVPAEEQARLLRAESELVWNVLASCRLLEVAAATKGRRDVLLAASPEAGDFVQRRGNNRGGAEPAAESPVVPLRYPADAAPYVLHDIVIPIPHSATAGEAGCESIAAVKAALGLGTAAAAPRHLRHQRSGAATGVVQPVQSPACVFRPLFHGATGYPRAARPWARSFAEPADGAATAGGTGVFTLATDWELASSSGMDRDYAAQSRGPRAEVWPLSKRGHALSARLPVGLLAVASASGSSLRESAASPSRHHASRCLAIHCTLPADMPLSNYLCEFTSVVDLGKTA